MEIEERANYGVYLSASILPIRRGGDVRRATASCRQWAVVGGDGHRPRKTVGVGDVHAGCTVFEARRIVCVGK